MTDAQRLDWIERYGPPSTRNAGLPHGGFIAWDGKQYAHTFSVREAIDIQHALWGKKTPDEITKLRKFNFA